MYFWGDIAISEASSFDYGFFIYRLL